MKIDLLQRAVNEIKFELEEAITSGSYNENLYENGQEAKEALIRSQNLILKIHEVVKLSLLDEISKIRQDFQIYPPIGSRSPEKVVFGFLKAKKQDIVVIFDDEPNRTNRISEGPLAGAYDELGKEKSEKSIVIGVRSQLSSVAKNFDTLMERSFAETLNLRLRLPQLVMGDVYLIPLNEYDDGLMKRNMVGWKTERVDVARFIRTFSAISDRSINCDDSEIYKYERVALVIVDFRNTPPRIISSTEELIELGCLSTDTRVNFNTLSPINFVSDLFDIYQERHKQIS